MMRIFLTLLKLLGVWVVSYLLGAAVTGGYLSFTSGIEDGLQWSLQDVVWSFPVFVLAFPLVYLPSMFVLRWILGGVKPAIAFPIVAGILYLVPTAMIFLLYNTSHWFQFMFSSENIEQHIMFIVAGIFFGLGFVLVLSKGNAQQLVGPERRERVS